ncbi:MAG: hypothetical protein KAX51_11605 [Chromatiaceae bacterium]|nr:hypothetical protein [Chromatiaceae bacterium]MBP8290430.1 hypothetical protein [Chromatiaceae bacterium]
MSGYLRDTIAISRKALQAAMGKVKELTPRGTHLTLETSIERINSWYVGWSSYFAMTYYTSPSSRRSKPTSCDDCDPVWWINKRANVISTESGSSMACHAARRQAPCSPTKAAGRSRTPSR